jgi:hypothetical protein
MARIRETLTAVGTGYRNNTVVPAYVIVERRRQRDEILRRVAKTIVGQAHLEEAGT